MQLVAFYEYLDYQRSNEKPYIERTDKKKDKRRKKDLQNITQRTKDWANDHLIKSRKRE